MCSPTKGDARPGDDQAFSEVSVDFDQLQETSKARRLPRRWRAYGIASWRRTTKHRALLDQNKLGPTAAEHFRRVLSGNVSEDDLPFSFKWLTDALYEYHKQPVVILMTNTTRRCMRGTATITSTTSRVSCVRSCLRVSRNNSSLFKGVMTGILRVARENMFSDLNHISVYSIIDDAYATCFGFTEGEVREIIEPERFEDVRAWYDGYVFGGHVIYNPWSILHYIQRGDSSRIG